MVHAARISFFSFEKKAIFIKRIEKVWEKETSMFYFILFHLHRLISSEKLPGIVAFYHRFYNYFWLLNKLNFCFPNFSQSLIDGKFKEFGNSRKGITMNAKNFGMCECSDAKSNIFTVFSFSIVSLLLVILNLLIKNCPSDVVT